MPGRGGWMSGGYGWGLGAVFMFPVVVDRWRRRKRNSAPRMITPTMTPTTAPTIAPVLVFFLGGTMPEMPEMPVAFIEGVVLDMELEPDFSIGETVPLLLGLVEGVMLAMELELDSVISVNQVESTSIFNLSIWLLYFKLGLEGFSAGQQDEHTSPRKHYPWY